MHAKPPPRTSSAILLSAFTTRKIASLFNINKKKKNKKNRKRKKNKNLMIKMVNSCSWLQLKREIERTIVGETQLI